MHLTVAICTHNRSALLGRTLEAMTQLVIPDGVTWELLVANNASTDDSSATIATYQSRLPVRELQVMALGKSHAANAAVGASTGEYVLWTDDDVLPAPTWLAAYAEAFRANPGDAFFGGPVEPLFEGSPPAWLAGALPEIANVYAAVDYGPDPLKLEGSRLPYGANMAVRALEQRRHPYDPALGRRGALMLAGEEWGVMSDMLASGHTGRWVPGARVRHIIPASRQSVRYVRDYYRGNGESFARVHSTEGEAVFLGKPRWVWREAVVNEVAWRVARWLAPPRVWSARLRRASTAWGMLRTPR